MAAIQKPAFSQTVPGSQLLAKSGTSKPHVKPSDDFNKSLNVRPDEYPSLLYELNENALNLIYSESYEGASALLLKATFLLNALNAGSSRQNAGIILLTYHNLALCYQKLGLLEECGNSLQVCLKQVPALVAVHPTAENRLKHMKYVGKLHMQYCAVLSQQSRHIIALDHAKYGAKYIHQTIVEVTKLAENYVLLPFSTVNSEVAPHNASFIMVAEGETGTGNSVPPIEGISLLEGTARKVLPILHEFCSKIATEGKYAKPGQSQRNLKLNMRNMFGFMSCSESVLGLNIGNIMQMSPLSLVDICSDCEKQLELTRESLLEKAALVVVAYFCLSTEKRFLAQEPTEAGRRAAKQSEFWHAKALEIACCFLPGECPLVTHIFMSYQKHHSPLQQAIPEDCASKEDIEILKPLTGAQQLPFQPIIRALRDPSQVFCLTPPADRTFDLSYLFLPTPRPSTSLSGTKGSHTKQANSFNSAVSMLYSGSAHKPRPNNSTIRRKPVIRIHNRQLKSVNMVDPANASFLAGTSIEGEDSIIVPRRPKSSQGGSISSTLKAKAGRTKIIGELSGGTDLMSSTKYSSTNKRRKPKVSEDSGTLKQLENEEEFSGPRTHQPSNDLFIRITNVYAGGINNNARQARAQNPRAVRPGIMAGKNKKKGKRAEEDDMFSQVSVGHPRQQLSETDKDNKRVLRLDRTGGNTAYQQA